MNDAERANQATTDTFIGAAKLIAHYQELCLTRGGRSDWANLKRSLQCYHALAAVALMATHNSSIAADAVMAKFRNLN